MADVMADEEELKIAGAFGKCADVRLPDDFADRLVERIRRNESGEAKMKNGKTVFVRGILAAASLTMLLGFVPIMLERPIDTRAEAVSHRSEIRAERNPPPQDGQFSALAFLGFCREVIRRRVRPLLSRRREEE